MWPHTNCSTDKYRPASWRLGTTAVHLFIFFSFRSCYLCQFQIFLWRYINCVCMHTFWTLNIQLLDNGLYSKRLPPWKSLDSMGMTFCLGILLLLKRPLNHRRCLCTAESTVGFGFPQFPNNRKYNATLGDLTSKRPQSGVPTRNDEELKDAIEME